MFVSADESSVPKCYGQLLLMLVMQAFMSWIFFVVLLDVSRPLELIGLVVLVHLVVTCVTLFTFHLCDKAVAVSHASGLGKMPSSNVPPCVDLCGHGGVKQAFVFYVLAFALYTHRIGLLYTTCALNSFRVHFTATEWTELTFAAFFIVAAIFFAELGRRDTTPPSAYD